MLNKRKDARKEQDAELESRAEERREGHCRVIEAGVDCGRHPVLLNRRLFACIDHNVERVRVRVKRHLGFEARGRSRVP